MRRVAVRLALVAALAAACSPPSGGETSASPQAPGGCRPRGLLEVGDELPDCSFRLFGGGQLRLASIKGRPAVINFWASWCVYCIEEMPAFQRVWASLEGKVAFVGADLLGIEGETESAARTFAKRTGVAYPLIFDERGLLFSHISTFRGRPILPATIFVKADGTIAFRQFGPLSEATLRARISEHLGVP